MIKKLLKDPLTHMLIVGGLLFWGYDLLNPNVNQSQDATFVVSQDEVNRFLSQKISENSEVLTESIKKHWVQAFINDELLYQEAKRLGLDHDAFIRERLIQKARFYLEGQFVIPEIDEETLQQFYQENISSYREKKAVSFEHRLLDTDGLAQVEKALASGLPEEELLSRIAPFQKRSLISPQFQNARKDGLARLFGNEFAEMIFEQPLNQWEGLLESNNGYHIVKLISLDEGSVQAFDEVREKVKEDWIVHQRNRWVDQRVMSLWDKYQIDAEDFLPNA